MHVLNVRLISQSGICGFMAVPSVLRKTADVCTCVGTLSGSLMEKRMNRNICFVFSNHCLTGAVMFHEHVELEKRLPALHQNRSVCHKMFARLLLNIVWS